MKLPSFRRLFTSDYPSKYKDLIDILSVSINNGIEVLYNALNNNLTLRDNLSATVKDVTIKTDASGNVTQGASFALNTTAKLDGVIVISAINQDNSSVYPSGGVTVSGSQSGKTFTIANVTGLQSGANYTLRIVAFTQ